MNDDNEVDDNEDDDDDDDDDEDNEKVDDKKRNLIKVDDNQSNEDRSKNSKSVFGSNKFKSINIEYYYEKITKLKQEMKLTFDA